MEYDRLFAARGSGLFRNDHVRRSTFERVNLDFHLVHFSRIGFARSIYDRLRDEYKDVASITYTSLPPKVLDYCRGLFTDELYQQLMSVTNQIERKLTKSDFDGSLPTPLSTTSPALEFVKSVCCLLFLLHDMHDDVMNLRRDLLKLLKLSEYIVELFLIFKK